MIYWSLEVIIPSCSECELIWKQWLQTESVEMKSYWSRTDSESHVTGVLEEDSHVHQDRGTRDRGRKGSCAAVSQRKPRLVSKPPEADFPGSPVVKSLPSNAGAAGSVLGWGTKSHWPAACMLSHFSHVWLLVTLWTVAHQAPLSMGFSRQESWRGLPCSPPGDLPDPEFELVSLQLEKPRSAPAREISCALTKTQCSLNK